MARIERDAEFFRATVCDGRDRRAQDFRDAVERLGRGHRGGATEIVSQIGGSANFSDSSDRGC